jgi:hypothetical protein
MNYCIGVILALIATLSLASCDDSNSGNANNAPDQPADEAAFIAAKTQIASDYDQAPNDIVKGQIYDRWRNGGSCAALKSPKFADWTGTVKSILSDGGFIVEMGDGVSVEADVDQSSPVFKVISGLREGDSVKISGAFVSDDSKCAAQVIAPPWGDSAVKSPDFKVTFSEVAAL